MKIKNKTAVITGASRGIGRAIAVEFAGLGYNLALISRHREDLELVVKELEREGRSRTSLPFQCDLRNQQQVTATFLEINQYFSRIDVLVNNAGVNSRRTFNPKEEQWFQELDKNLQDWNEEIQTNLTGTYLCSYLAAGYMLKQRSGSIINISSIKGIEPTTSPGYGASKAGVIKLSKDFAKALAPSGIRVNCIAPGFIDTGMTTELSEEKKESYRKMIPQGRFGTVEEVAKVVAFLASDGSSYVNGAVFNVNGGYLM